MKNVVLGGLTILDETGQSVALGDLWAQGRVVVVLVRHFGCLFCQQQVVELQKARSDFEAHGARVVVVGNGTPNFIVGFREQSGFDGEIYTDPSRRVYEALDLRSDLLATFNPRALANAIKAMRAGFRQSRVRGHPWQQGGVFIIDQDGEMTFAYRSQNAGDHPPVRSLIEAAAQVAEVSAS